MELIKNAQTANSDEINMYGSGTERVEEVLKSAFTKSNY
jgi:primosomal protein N'